MSSVLVTSSAGLVAALQSAQSGDTIMLAPGAYANLTIQGFHAAGSVTITSADPTHPASLVDLKVFDSSGLTFTHLELTQTAGSLDPYPTRISGSTRITLDHVSVHGSLNGNPTGDNAGLLVTNSTYVSITNSEFQQLSFGVVHTGADYLIFSNNSVHDIRFAGVHGTSSYVAITSNTFTDFYPAAGDHPDAIHFFNQTSTDAPHDIVVSDNIIVRGSGAAIQGIYFELPTASVVAPHNITITDNLLIGTMYNAIAVLGNADAPFVNVNVSDNSISSIGDMTARIWLGNTVDAIVAGNQAGAFIYGKTDVTFDAHNTNAGIVVVGNNLTTPVTDGGAALLSAWLGQEDFVTSQPSEPITAIAEPAAPAKPAAAAVTEPDLAEPPVPEPVVVETSGLADSAGATDSGVRTIVVVNPPPAPEPAPEVSVSIHEPAALTEPFRPYLGSGTLRPNLGSVAFFGDGDLIQLLGLARGEIEFFI